MTPPKGAALCRREGYARNQKLSEPHTAALPVRRGRFTQLNTEVPDDTPCLPEYRKKYREQ